MRQAKYICRGFLVTKLVLVLLLGYTIVQAVILPQRPEIFAPVAAVGTDKATLAEGKSPGATSTRDYSAIIEQNIFRGTASTLTANRSLPDGDAESQRPSVEKELGLILLGTIAGKPVISRAIIKDMATNLAGLYKTGDTVADVSVESIQADAVILLHKGQRRQLNLNTTGDHLGKDAQQPPSPTVDDRSKAGKPELLIERTAAEIPLENDSLEAILKRAVVEPYEVDGEVEGLRLTGLEDTELVKDLGLRNGDIVCVVNGQQVTSKQKAFQVLRKARSQGAIDMELLRGDKTERLSVPLP